jgi:hypothetical protein
MGKGLWRCTTGSSGGRNQGAKRGYTLQTRQFSLGSLLANVDSLDAPIFVVDPNS